MGRRIFAIVVIFIATSLAWVALGATIFARTHGVGERLTERVGSTWGTAHSQPMPYLVHAPTTARPSGEPAVAGAGSAPAADAGSTAAAAAGGPRPTPDPAAVEQRTYPARTRAVVDLQLEHRRKGLLWYSTYGVRFAGAFVFRNDAGASATLRFPLPADQAMYDDLRVAIDGAEVPYEIRGRALVMEGRVPPGGEAALAVSYRSQGLDSWRYALGGDVAQVRDFDLLMRTNFRAVDFPDNTLSPTEKRSHLDGWELRWSYANLLTGFDLAMEMPRRLQPGPLAGRIALFAPVSLLFFFAVMFILATLRGIDLHPMNYLFLAGAFFAFHLLLAYLVDHIRVEIAFLIASIVSVALVVSYLRLAVGPRFAIRQAGTAQFIYLVLFSLAFFFEGFTGLTITIGAILTLFVAMQTTGRVRWSEVFIAPPKSATPAYHRTQPAPAVAAPET